MAKTQGIRDYSSKLCWGEPLGFVSTLLWQPNLFHRPRPTSGFKCVSLSTPARSIEPAPCVTYDQRFQQIRSQLFSQLSACSLGTNSTVCTTSADCTVAPFTFCNNPTGNTGAGVCINLNPLCNFGLILSTLSAHSFDFIVPVGIGKPHTIVTSRSTIGNPGKNAISCVGPGVTTVTQTKVFNNSAASRSELPPPAPDGTDGSAKRQVTRPSPSPGLRASPEFYERRAGTGDIEFASATSRLSPCRMP